MKCKIRYANIPATDIFNWLAPRNVTFWNAFPEWRDKWWTPEIVSLREQCEKIWINRFDEQTHHYSNLEKSILEHGIAHPVKVLAGPPMDRMMAQQFPISVVPTIHRNDQLLSTHQFGGSRLFVAQKFNMDVPCLIYDFSDKFPDFDEVNIDDIARKLKPHYQTYTYPSGIKTLIVHNHIHLNNNTPVVPRDAQTKATEHIKKIVTEIENGSNI